MAQKTLGALIAPIRKKMGLLQKEAAPLVGMTRETYSQMETSRRKEPVTPAQAQAISKVFGLSMFEIVNAMGFPLFFEGIEDEGASVLLRAYLDVSDDRRQIAQLALGLAPAPNGDPLLDALRQLAETDHRDRRETRG